MDPPVDAGETAGASQSPRGAGTAEDSQPWRLGFSASQPGFGSSWDFKRDLTIGYAGFIVG